MGDTRVGLSSPNFSEPPVHEVATSFGFGAIDEFQFAAMADLRARWLADYPRAEEQPYLEPSGGPQQSIRVEFGQPPRRLWLIGPSGDRLLQVQRDRLIANWRRLPELDMPYPRYTTLRADFRARWDDFVQFVSERFDGLIIQPQYAEVTYVNVVEISPSESLAIRDVLVVAGRADLEEEGMTTNSYAESWQTGGGRDKLSITANVDAGMRGAPMVIHVAANVEIDETRTTWSALDRAHELVVGTFGVITTKAMQKRWGRIS